MNITFKILKTKINDFIRKTLPIKLTLALTFMCNSKCKTCNIWKIYKKSPEKVREELTTKDWKKLFDEIGNNLGWIEFTGGEPFLRKDIDEVVIYAYNNTAISAGGLTTNGIISKRILQVVKRIVENIPNGKILNIGISVDGVPEVHDEIRGISGNFEKAAWLFDKLKELKYIHKNLAVHFAYTISQYNAGKFRDFYDFMKESYGVSIDEITVTFEHFTEYYGRKFDRGSYESFKINLIKDIKYYLQKINENRHKNLFHRIKLAFYKFYLRNIPEFVNKPRKMIIPCVAGKYSAYIDPYGNVYPCTQWLLKLGNLKERSFKEIWWGKKAEEVRKSIKNSKCPNCWTPCEAQPSWVMNFGLLRGWW
ncbi:radical SAM protein [bacterium]|nr:radical SAM protein [bacterium]